MAANGRTVDRTWRRVAPTSRSSPSSRRRRSAIISSVFTTAIDVEARISATNWGPNQWFISRSGSLRRIIAADDGARILILTTFGLDEYIYEALSAGASGFVLKDDPPEQLIAAVRTVAVRPR